MKLKNLCKVSYNQALSKGFHDDSLKIPKKMRRLGFSASEVRAVEVAFTNQAVLLSITELAESCEALRHNRVQSNAVYGYKHGRKKPRVGWCKDTFEDEIADTFIRLADMCDGMGIDIEWQLKKKLAYNKLRPRLHGKKF
jgi:NTP pyrophosphatase (non-canonical NTP hydrolase)